MKKRKTSNLLVMLIILSAAVLMTFFSFSTAHAEAKQTIPNVSLKISTSDIEIGSVARSISADSADENKYYVKDGSGSATNMPGDKWTAKSIPTFSINIKAESGYKFDTNKLRRSEYYTFTGDTIHFVKASGGSTSITLTVKMNKLQSTLDPGNLGISNLELDENSANVTWDAVDMAEVYQVKVYRGSTLINSTDTGNTSYNFAGSINQTGTYSVKVRAVAGSLRGEYSESDSLYVDSSNIGRFNGGGNNSGASGWQRDKVGWWYRNPNGTYTVSNWQFINNQWYFFNSSGYMVTGWIRWKDNWYYCNASGAMLTNTTTPDGYRVDANGAWIR